MWQKRRQSIKVNDADGVNLTKYFTKPSDLNGNPYETEEKYKKC